MSLYHQLVELSDVNESLLSSDGNNSYFNVELTVQNVDEDAYVYIGTSGVSSSSYGMLVYPGSMVAFSKLREEDAVYAVSSINGSKVAIFGSSSVLKKPN